MITNHDLVQPLTNSSAQSSWLCPNGLSLQEVQEEAVLEIQTERGHSRGLVGHHCRPLWHRDRAAQWHKVRAALWHRDRAALSHRDRAALWHKDRAALNGIHMFGCPICGTGSPGSSLPGWRDLSIRCRRAFLLHLMITPGQGGQHRTGVCEAEESALPKNAPDSTSAPFDLGPGAAEPGLAGYDIGQGAESMGSTANAYGGMLPGVQRGCRMCAHSHEPLDSQDREAHHHPHPGSGTHRCACQTCR